MAKVGLGAVAAAAGVSEATVSRVINNPTIVTSDTRKSVEAAMRSVGYRRPASGGNLVLLITPGLSDAFFGQLSDRMSAALALQGMHAVICSAPVGGTQEFEYVSAMVDAGAVAAVFVSASNTLIDADPSAHQLLTSRGVPFVCINGAFDGVTAPTLSANDRLAADIAVEHLWQLGHRRIGLVAGPVGNRPSDLRAEGFLAGMLRRGATADDAPVIRHEYSVEGGTAATEAILDSRMVSAVIAASDEMALGAIRAVRRRGLSVPTDISVVGYDDALPLEFMDPPLTTVRQPLERLAQAVVPVLSRLIKEGTGYEGELLFEPELVIRSSTAPPSLLDL